MTDTTAVANYRTRLEADVAARFLDAAGIPCVINSPEGMLYGPLGVGATILVRPADVELARDALLLEREPVRTGRGVILLAVLAETTASDGLIDGLRTGGVPVLVHAGAGRVEVWVRREHADRAARLLDDRRRSGT